MQLKQAPEPTDALIEVARVLRRGESFSSSSTSAPRILASRAGRTGSKSPGGSSPTAVIATATALATIEASPLTVESFKRGLMPLAPMFMKPLVYGSATLSA